MSQSLEMAMMLDAVAALSTNPKTRAELRKNRDALLTHVPGEIARQAEASKWLLESMARPITGGPFEVQIEYV